MSRNPRRNARCAGRDVYRMLPREAMMKFDELNLIPPILQALAAEGYEVPTPIQEQAIPVLLKGRDLLGCAQTGTGKTAAFAIPILQLIYQEKQQEKARVASGTNETESAYGPAGQEQAATSLAEQVPQTAQREPEGHGPDRDHRHRRKKPGAPQSFSSGKPVAPIRALILTPTRELALQIEESFLAYGRFLDLAIAVVFGGVSQANQTAALKKGVDILVATPGRLLDLVGQRYINLHHIRILVLDEADRMLDMGFAPDVKRIIGLLPKVRQTMLFSATMPHEILHLVDTVLEDPEEVSVTPVASTVDAIDQYVFHLSRINKRHLLVWLLKNPELKSVLVFCRTKHGAERIYRELDSEHVNVEAIHGDKPQVARQIALNNFKTRKARVLVATDIAARGIDVDDISHVINYDMPDVPESYVHRIGRTGRAGATGIAFSFCDEEEKPNLRAIIRLTKSEIKPVYDHPFNTETEMEKPAEDVKKIPFAGAKRKRGHRGGRSFG
jgi:ATP-dependent RNA helicase RhlE